MKFIFVVVVAQITFLIIGLLISFLEKKTCLSKSCKELANDIKQNLDTSVNPCDDFYRFTCGKVVNGGDPKSNGDMLDTLAAQIGRIWRLLKEGLKPGEPKAYAKVKTIYKKCTEDKASDDEKMRKIKELFQQMGGFPILEGDKWNETGWTWLETTKKIRERGLFCDSMFTLGPIPNLYDHKNNLGINNPVFPAFEACAINLQECQSLYNATILTAVLEFGVSKEEAEKGAVEIFGLEKQLFELSKTHVSIDLLKQDKDSERNLTNMTASFGYIDWPKLVGIMLQKDNVPNNFEMLVFNPGYMESLKTIFETTSNKVMANYMMWRVLQSSVLELSLYPGNKSADVCFAFVLNVMDLLLTPMYLEKYPDPHGTDLDMVVGIVNWLKDDILAAIKNADWMSEQVKKISTRKIMFLKQRIGDLKLLSVSFVEDFYRGLSVEGDAYEAMSSAVKFSADKSFESCNGWSAVFIELASMPAYTTNAFYLGMDNSFNLLHGILQKPLFDPGWPASINYGRIGSIVGHEITHSLDESGHHFDEHGNLTDTWDRETYEKFNKTSQCLADQFDAFYNASSLKSPKFTGSYKSPENMADTGGSKLAFLAYRKYTDSLFWPDFLLPGLDYSSDQLFFIGFALFWCSKMDWMDQMKDVPDPHAPARYRVLKTLRNNPHFAEVFGCHQGDRMNSGRKCDVW